MSAPLRHSDPVIESIWAEQARFSPPGAMNETIRLKGPDGEIVEVPAHNFPHGTPDFIPVEPDQLQHLVREARRHALEGSHMYEVSYGQPGPTVAAQIQALQSRCSDLERRVAILEQHQ